MASRFETLHPLVSDLHPPPYYSIIINSELSLVFYTCVYNTELSFIPSCGRIRMKLGGHIGCVTRKNWFNFGEDLNLDPDLIIF